MPVAKIIIGPLLTDLNRIGMDGDQVDLATAFYSKRALESLDIKARRVRFFVRLNLQKPDEWIAGMVNPAALLQTIGRLQSQNTDIELFVSPRAHAKLYVGNIAAIIGSANLTLGGFGGGLEIVNLADDPAALHRMRLVLDNYAKQLCRIDMVALERYVNRYQDFIPARIKKGYYDADSLPVLERDRLGFLGTYNTFKSWLNDQPNSAAKEILDRAAGKANLSGHIHRNFYGLRQLYLAYPALITQFWKMDASAYRLSKDQNMEAVIKEFVAHYAVDEKDGLSVSTWRTYLPRECGGRAAKHGGTIGNLNRMLPLVAQYLKAIGVK